MYLTSLSITNFRLFSRLEVNLPRRSLLLIGENAQGKTSFLEAIHFFSTLSSLHAQNNRELINFLILKENTPVSRLIAEFERKDGKHKMEIRLILDPGTNGTGRLRKEILVDGIKFNQQSAIGQFYSVVFLPQMMRILEGGPEDRRRFLDHVLCQAFPGYAKDLNDYSLILSQRNALLKQLAERNGDLEQLQYWDEILTNHGAKIIYSRIRAVQEIEILAQNEHKNLTNEMESLHLIYMPAYDPIHENSAQLSLSVSLSIRRDHFSIDEIRAGFIKKLIGMRKEEIKRGMTTIGPHRDDFRAVSNGIDLGVYGSRGQIRSAILSLKLAETDWLKEKTGECPVLLLDEILAELDMKRRLDLLRTLADCDQAVMTTTDLHLFPADFTEHCTIWEIQSGKLIQ